MRTPCAAHLALLLLLVDGSTKTRSIEVNLDGRLLPPLQVAIDDSTEPSSTAAAVVRYCAAHGLGPDTCSQLTAALYAQALRVPAPTVADDLKEAYAAYKRGDLQQSATAFERVLSRAAAPDVANAALDAGAAPLSSEAALNMKLEARYGLSAVARDRGQLDQAQRHHDEAVALLLATASGHGNDTDFRSLTTLGQLRYSEGRFREATVALSRALEVNPTSVLAAMNAGKALVHEHRYDEALAMYSAFVGRSARLLEVLVPLSLVYCGHCDEAVFAAALDTMVHAHMARGQGQQGSGGITRVRGGGTPADSLSAMADITADRTTLSAATAEITTLPPSSRTTGTMSKGSVTTKVSGEVSREVSRLRSRFFTVTNHIAIIYGLQRRRLPGNLLHRLHAQMQMQVQRQHHLHHRQPLDADSSILHRTDRTDRTDPSPLNVDIGRSSATGNDNRDGAAPATVAHPTLHAPLSNTRTRVGSGIKRTRVHLIVEAYLPRTPERGREIGTCLQRNVENPYIEQVHLLGETAFHLQWAMKQVAHLPWHLQAKIVGTVVGARATFRDTFEYAWKRLAGTLCVVANSDIYFDQSLGEAPATYERFKQTLGALPVLALLRWDDQPSGGALLSPRVDSQDAWLFEPSSALCSSSFDFHFGKIRADNVLSWHLNEKGFVLVNPCLRIRVFHLHLSEERTYQAMDIVHGDMGGCLLSI